LNLMKPAEPTAAISRPSWLRRLDYIPAWLAVALGVGTGAFAGAVLALGTPMLAGVGFVASLTVAVMLAYHGKPITVLERTVAPGKEPEPTIGTVTKPEPVPPKPSLVELVNIPAGTFHMGSLDYDNEGPVHEVHISAFQCMRFLVTRRLYKELMGKDPGWPEGEADDRPINNVSWYDAVRFCNRLSEQEGLTPCYRIDGNDVSWEYAANGYRLPTEAEWEYACRAGTQTLWSFGGGEKDLGRYAWYTGNSGNLPQPVGTRDPNPWGLYDMHGNVWEWCWDWYDAYSAESQTDPTGPLTGDWRVLRGGAFTFSAWGLRSAYRDWDWPVYRFRYGGVRCVRGSRRQP
jgi:formylglycine-generating enzyme required for sulfatase activity